MKKKNLVLLGATAMLSLALAGSLGAVNVASAETKVDNGKGASTTTVTYSAEDAWKVTIPETITIGGQDPITVSASEVKIEKGKKLKVTVSSANGWKVKSGDKELDYELKKGGTTLDNDSNNTVLEVEAGTPTGSETLTANMKDTAANYSTGGESYTDTLTFTVTVA